MFNLLIVGMIAAVGSLFKTTGAQRTAARRQRGRAAFGRLPRGFSSLTPAQQAARVRSGERAAATRVATERREGRNASARARRAARRAAAAAAPVRGRGTRART